MSKPEIIQETIPLGDGRSVTIETGLLAKQADGSVVVRTGKTMLLATVVSAREAKEDVDFMPLSVDYKEKYASLGKFPGGFLKREARPSDYEVLVSRLVDRALRPLFPEDYHSETFVNITLFSAESDTPPDALAGLAASAALAVSDVPFNGPISEVRVARVDGKLVINPTFSQMENADIELIVGATKDNVLMVEGEMNEVSEADMLEAIRFAHDAIKTMCDAQLALMKKAGREKKREYSHEENDEALRDRIRKETYDQAYKVAASTIKDKHLRSEAFSAIRDELLARLQEEAGEEAEVNEMMVSRYYHEVEKEAVRRLILDKAIRLDGRKTDEIRPIWCEVDYLPSAHGSALFTRGETQSLTTVTLGTRLDEKMIDDVMKKGTEKFVLHYNFPPFSTGDARPSRGTSRREVGHGNLAHRALKRMVPTEELPYAVRIVSDILESNGSSSMATVCAGTLALMDSGVQIRKPVSGIAMGLITDSGSGKFAVLSDILGDEDHLGDMDFKVTGTSEGITATQMDIKVEGLSYEILAQALEQARKGRLHILEVMRETIAEPNPDYKPHTPRIERIEIPKDMIGAVIGPGGKVIQEIQAETNSTITIEEIGNVGLVDVFAVDKASIDAAMQRIRGIVAVPEVGEVYNGKVRTITPYGAFVEILPGKDGLLHISEIEWRRLEKVEEVLKEGDQVQVKLIAVDEKNGKLKLSRKVLLPRPERVQQEGEQREGQHQERQHRGRPHEARKHS